VPLFEAEMYCTEGSWQEAGIAVESEITLRAKEWEYGVIWK